MSRRRWPQRLLTGLYWYLAASFLVGAATKFWPGPTFFGPAYAEKFADWGYPPWFRFLVGGLELVCAVMFIVPRRRFRFLAAVGLMLLLTGAVTTHIVNQDPLYQSVSAPVHLLMAGLIALVNWPAGWRLLLAPWRPA